MSERITSDQAIPGMTRDAVDEADLEEQEMPLVEPALDEEAVVGSEPGPRREEVDEADYLEQLEQLTADDDDYSRTEDQDEY